MPRTFNTILLFLLSGCSVGYTLHDVGDAEHVEASCLSWGELTACDLAVPFEEAESLCDSMGFGGLVEIGSFDEQVMVAEFGGWTVGDRWWGRHAGTSFACSLMGVEGGSQPGDCSSSRPFICESTTVGAQEVPMDPFTIGGLIFTGVTVASLVGLNVAKVVVPRVGAWSIPPDVHVSTSCRVSVNDVRKAVAFWADRGFQFGTVLTVDTITGPIPGCIFVGPVDQMWNEGVIGRAVWLAEYPMGEDELERPEDDYLSNAADIIQLHEGVIRHAVIQVDPAGPKSKHVDILIHELGHALGFLHCEAALFGRRRKNSKNGKRLKGSARLQAIGRKRGHVMHPLLSEMGKGKNSTKGMTPP